MARLRQRLVVALVLTVFAVCFLCQTIFTTQGFFVEKRSNSAREATDASQDALTDDTAAVAGGSAPSGPLLIMLLSSMPRSGSTVLTDLLNTIENSVMFFEPLWPVEKNKELYRNVTYVTKYMRDIYTCDFTEEFHRWLKDKDLFVRYFSKELKKCNKIKDPKEKDNCRDLRKLCNAAPIRQMKLIRGRLRWTKTLLEDPDLNLKIIHLARDPRGSLNSIRKFGWNSDPFTKCSELEDDLISYDALHKLFPTKVMQVHYEQFCLHPVEISNKIFRFLFGNQPLPEVVKDFIDKHMTEEKRGSMSTFKNGQSHYDKWRFDIPEKVLHDIEKEPSCLSAIYRMKHNVLGSLENARNASIPVLTQKNSL